MLSAQNSVWVRNFEYGIAVEGTRVASVTNDDEWQDGKSVLCHSDRNLEPLNVVSNWNRNRLSTVPYVSGAIWRNGGSGTSSTYHLCLCLCTKIAIFHIREFRKPSDRVGQDPETRTCGGWTFPIPVRHFRFLSKTVSYLTCSRW